MEYNKVHQIISEISQTLGNFEEQILSLTAQVKVSLQKIKILSNIAQQYHTILDAVPDRIVCLTNDLRIIWANKTAANLAKMSFDEILGMFCYSVFQKKRSTMLDMSCD